MKPFRNYSKKIIDLSKMCVHDEHPSVITLRIKTISMQQGCGVK